MGEVKILGPRNAIFKKQTGSLAVLQVALPEVYLHPGQNHVGATPITLKMILGSCAGVFLFDPILRVGGATHFMLPHHGEGQMSGRYGDIALKQLLDGIWALGSNRKNIQAKVFGGASMLPALRDQANSNIGQIGRRNIEIAYEILERESIAIVERNVFGNQGRKISMISNTGEIELQFVNNTNGN
jgi:chemotaxis protein CheD